MTPRHNSLRAKHRSVSITLNPLFKRHESKVVTATGLFSLHARLKVHMNLVSGIVRADRLGPRGTLAKMMINLAVYLDKRARGYPWSTCSGPGMGAPHRL